MYYLVMKLIFAIFFSTILVFLSTDSRAQVADSTKIKQQEIPEIRAEKDYNKKYRTALRRVRRVYPLALYAAQQIKELDNELAQVDSRRKKKKIAKVANKELKTDFQYVVRDLYIEEGKLLMKLIHRETGMTVAQIIKKYRGGFRSELQDNLGKIWEQDLDAKYDPKGEDWIVERVILDIQANTVPFEPEAKKLTKEEFKDKQKQYRIDKREAKKAMRAKRKSGSE